MILYPSVRWDEIDDLPYDLWTLMCQRVDAWRQGRLSGGSHASR